jgi:hypothetical protein
MDVTARRQCRIVGGHEFIRARQPRKAELWVPYAAKVKSRVPVPVRIFNDISQSNLDHRCIRAHAAASSQGLLESPPGNASNASSSRARSQTVRLLIRLDCGIRPSFTIASNKLGETPTYAAASDRDNPRGESAPGRIRVGGAAAWCATSLGSRNDRAQGPDSSESKASPGPAAMSLVSSIWNQRWPASGGWSCSRRLRRNVNRVAFLFKPVTAPYLDYYLNPLKTSASDVLRVRQPRSAALRAAHIRISDRSRLALGARRRLRIRRSLMLIAAAVEAAFGVDAEMRSLRAWPIRCRGRDCASGGGER